MVCFQVVGKYASSRLMSSLPRNNIPSRSLMIMRFSSKPRAGDKRYDFMTKERRMFGSISEMCGHSAAVCTVLAYLSTDILVLRSLAIGSGLLGCAFQYYRPQPLWIPIRWNMLLLAINSYMVTNLLIERHRANNLPYDKKRLYDLGDFDERGFSKVQFMKFFELGNRRVFSGKEFISQENRIINKLYYVVDGNATVTCITDGRKLATITPHHFIGEMSFLVYCQSQKKDDDAPYAKASANVISNGIVHVWEWDVKELALAMKEDRDLSNAFASYCTHDLRGKLLLANAEGRSNS